MFHIYVRKAVIKSGVVLEQPKLLHWFTDAIPRYIDFMLQKNLIACFDKRLLLQYLKRIFFIIHNIALNTLLQFKVMLSHDFSVFSDIMIYLFLNEPY